MKHIIITSSLLLLIPLLNACVAQSDTNEDEDQWCLEACETKVDPVMEPDPLPKDAFINESYEHIYTYSDYACAIDKEDLTHCWGPAIDGVDDEPGRLADWDYKYKATSLKLEYDTISNIYSDGTPDLSQEGTLITSLISRRTFKSAHSSGQTLCGLDDYVAPLNKLYCQKTERFSNVMNMLERFELIGKPFKKFDISTHCVGCRTQLLCGLDMEDAIHCVTNNDKIILKGTFEDMHYGSYGQISALNASGVVHSWSSPAGRSVVRQGKYKKMYSVHCGLSMDDKIVCWGGYHAGVAITKPTIIYNKAPKSFAIHHDGPTTNWCAISQKGVVQCARF